MNITTSQVYDIRFLTEVSEVEGGLTIIFRDGSTAFLDASHSHFEVLRIHAECCQGRPVAVGVILDVAGGILDLNTAHDTSVRSIQECPDKYSRLEVGFWGYSPICYLTLDHPEFERIRSTLAGAVGTRTMVWVANHSQMEETDPTDEEEGETWWKIMDVRPV